MRVLETRDYRTLSLKAADIVADAIRRKPGIVLGLPTGHTPLGMYEELARRHRDEGLDFSTVRTFNLDEYRGLSPDHPRSYQVYMRDRFFAHVNVATENTCIPNGSAEVDPGAESSRYEQAILAAGGIDLLIVGVGANGHIAFNEPGSSFESRTRLVNLAPETISNTRIYFPSGTEIPRTAITMGIATILDARRIVLLASGVSKRVAIRRALQGPVSPSVPASALQLHSDLTVILDKAAM